MRCYLSLPMFTRNFNDLESYILETKAQLESYGYEVLHPLTATSFLRSSVIEHNGYSHPEATDRACFSRDRAMVQMADLIYCNCIGFQKPSTGCIYELAWAEIYNKQVILACASEQHAFIKQSIGIQFVSHFDSMEYLRKLRYGII